MGFFEKLKQAKNFVTGGGANVEIQQLNSDASEGQALRFKILCHVKDADLKIDNVYLEIKAEEEVRVEDYDISDSTGNMRRETITREHETFRQKVIVAEAQTLEAESNHEWEVEVSLPSNLHGSYRGINARHVWYVFAGLDKSGNDPDSGWQEIYVTM